MGDWEGSSPKNLYSLFLKPNYIRGLSASGITIYFEIIIYYNARRLTVLTKTPAKLVIMYCGSYIFENMLFSQSHEIFSSGKHK